MKLIYIVKLSEKAYTLKLQNSTRVLDGWDVRICEVGWKVSWGKPVTKREFKFLLQTP